MWKDNIYRELREQHLFQNSSHQTRFKELLDCYYNTSFFTPGLCKCMYMSCWDEEHFIIMLDMLNQLKLKDNMDLNDMNENGMLMAEEEVDHPYDYYVMRLSCAFLMDQPFDITRLPSDLDPKGRYIIEQSLKAAVIIDSEPFHRI